MMLTQRRKLLLYKLVRIPINDFISILILVFSFSVASRCQTQNDKLESIRQAFRAINNDTTLHRVTLKGDRFLAHRTDGGGKLVGFFKDNSVVKITEEVGLSFGMRRLEYYFKDRGLIFVYETEEDFPYDDSAASFDYTKLSKVFEGRYYFYNNVLIKRSIKGELFGGMTPNPSQFITDATKLSKLLMVSKNKR